MPGRAGILLLLLILTACGRTREGVLSLGDPCASAEECPIDSTCVGCSDEDRRCLAGCTTDADCSSGGCTQVECTTCPCPGSCEG